MRIKLNAPNKVHRLSLWKDSPCSMNYISRDISLDATPRFELGSIYYKDEVNKPKKIFNEFQKPDLLLHDFRRQIQQASHQKYNTAAKKKKTLAEKEKFKSRSMSMSTASNLYQVPQKTEYRYDIHGFRAHQSGDYNVKQILDRVKQNQKFFSFGRRIDLSRPLNFFPGPGTYDYSSEKSSRLTKTCTEFIKKKMSQVQNPQSQRYSIKRNISEIK